MNLLELLNFFELEGIFYNPATKLNDLMRRVFLNRENTHFKEHT